MRILSFLALLGTLAVSQGPQATDEKAFAGSVKEAELRRYVRELVAFGPRMGGTPSNDKSAAYLAAFFKKHGLTVTVQEDAPALAHWETSWKVALADGA